MFGRSGWLGLLLGVTACGQTIYVQADGGPGGGGSDGGVSFDGGVRTDGGFADAGGGVDRNDPGDSGVIEDMGPPDSGVCNAPCFAGLSPAAVTVNVGEIATIGLAMGSASPAELGLTLGDVRASRRPGLPTVSASDLTLDISLSDDQVQLSLTNVPEFFCTTTFTITVNSGVTGGSHTAAVTVRGNVVHGRYQKITAHASDGYLAGSGTLVDDTGIVREVADLLVTSRGTLVVLDRNGSSNDEILREISLTRPDYLLGTFDSTDAEGAPLLRSNQSNQGITELADGRIVASEWSYGDPDPSRLVLWTPTRSFIRVILPLGSRRFGAVAPRADGMLYVMDREARELVVLNPDTGREVEVIDIGRTLMSDLAVTESGSLIGGASGAIYRLDATTGARLSYSGIPGSAGTYEFLDILDGEGVVAGGANSGEMAILRLDREAVTGNWLASGQGVTFAVSGMAYLD